MYTITGEISVGSYGRVFRAKRDDTVVAIKEFKVGQRKRSILGAVNLKEVDHLKRCNHPFILKPIAITYTCPYRDPEKITKFTKTSEDAGKRLTDEVYAIMPLADTNLHHFIGNDECTVPMLKRFMLQITHALAYLHANRICYRDVKSLNILIFRDEKYSDAYNAILCDMGMCKPMTPAYMNSEHVGTPTYKAPEVVMSPGIYTYAVDVWSLGVLFIEMFNESHPFDRMTKDRKATVTDKEVLTSIFKNRGGLDLKTYNKLSKGGSSELIEFKTMKNWPKRSISELFAEDSMSLLNFEEISESLPNFGTMKEFIDLLEKMMEVDPDLRISMKDILSHSFFSQVPVSDGPNADMWRGLCNPLIEKAAPHVLKKTTNVQKRNLGIEVIDGISITYSREIMLRSMFLGIDLYDRCLLRSEELGMELGPNPSNPKALDPKLLAYTCCYIACKYFFDTSTPDLEIIFPRIEFSPDAIINMEKTILIELVEWRIYRTTVFDLLEDKTHPAKLSKLLKQSDKLYGHNVEKILVGFTEWLSKSQ